jgi:hypothetical protein
MIGIFRHFYLGDKPRKRLRGGGYLSLDYPGHTFYNVKNITISANGYFYLAFY